jgi:hypothetical protein
MLQPQEVLITPIQVYKNTKAQSTNKQNKHDTESITRYMTKLNENRINLLFFLD